MLHERLYMLSINATYLGFTVSPSRSLTVRCRTRYLLELSFNQRGTAFDLDDEFDDTDFFGLFSDGSGCDGSCGGGGTGRSSTRARMVRSNGAGTSTSV